MKSVTEHANKSDLDDISLINEQINESNSSNPTTTVAKSTKYLTVQQQAAAQQHQHTGHHHFFLNHSHNNNEISSDLFLQYVREGNLALVTECLKFTNVYSPYNTVTGAGGKDILNHSKQKIDLEMHDDGKQTPLLLATRLNHLEIARLLVENDARINKADADSWTPLLNASKNGNYELVKLLLEHRAIIEDKDMGGFTPLMWACYKNKIDIVKLLLSHGANPNAQCKNSICCLSWAAGRGHTDIVKELLKIPTIKVNLQDLNSSTPLLWAARKGNLEIVKLLVEKKANTELIGMNNMTPLIIASKNGHKETALYLSTVTTANLNHVDKDGNNALTISVKQGQIDVVLSLLSRGAYVNTPNKKGDNILITAVKGGHKQIIDALLDKHVEIDAIGNQGKTAMHHSVEKGNLDLVKVLLEYKPDLEITTKDGDTVLLLAVKKKSAVIVNELLNHGSKVSPTDKNGDNVLHISLRNRSREITELILANPKNSKYLYRPNKHGDTPHKIDASNPKSILTQIFGARQLNMSEDGILGYDLYSSALAEILSEPSLNTPITVGLYAKWGSGKSFLLSQLKSEMKSFAKLTRIVSLKLNFFLIVAVILMNLFITTPFCFWNIYYGLILFGSLNLVMFFMILISIYFYRRKEKDWAERACQKISSQLNRFKLLLRILFLNPNDYKNENMEHRTLRFLFTEYGKISTIGGESAFAIMIGSLYDKIEDEFGTVITRLCRSFFNKSHSHSKFRRVCCIPTFIIIILIILIIFGLAVFLRYKNFNLTNLNVQEQAFIGTAGFIVCVFILGSSFTSFKIIWNLIRSPKQAIIKSAQSRDKKRYSHDTKVESFIFKLKREVDLIAHTVRTIDIFNHSCTRLVIIIDGLDSCEQTKVVQILEIIHVLFTREGDPFVNILAVDPHVLIKGIEGNLTAVFKNGNVNGHDYLRTIIHLPVYLQVDLSKAKALSKEQNAGLFRHNNIAKNSIIGSSLDILNKIDSTDKSNRKLKKRRRSVKPMSAYDLTDQLIKSDYFLDVNPRNLRRLINIIALTGRLLRAYHIDFNWRVLASWIYISEQWPYRCSWIIMYYEDHEKEFTEETNINEIYKIVKCQIPVTNEPLLELDRSPRKFEQFLENSQPILNVSVLKKILPCSCNLDPLLIKLIKDSCDAMNDTLNRNNFPLIGSYSNFDQLNNNNHPLNPNNSISSFNHHFMHPHSNNHFNNNSHNNSFVYMNDLNNNNNSNKKIFDIQPLSEINYLSNNMNGLVHRKPQQVNKQESNEDSTVKIDLTKILCEMSRDDICEIINNSIEYMSDDFKEIYISLVKEKNINGKVLASCDINELKSELNMSFGDWQLFKSWLLEQKSAQTHLLQLKQMKKEQKINKESQKQQQHQLHKTSTLINSNLSQPLIIISEPIIENSNNSLQTPIQSNNSQPASPQRKVEFIVTPVKEDDLIINKKYDLLNDSKICTNNSFDLQNTSTATETILIENDDKLSDNSSLNNSKSKMFSSKTSIHNQEGTPSTSLTRKISKKIFKSIDNIFHPNKSSAQPTDNIQPGLSDNYNDNSSSVTPLISLDKQTIPKNPPSILVNNDDQYDYYYDEDSDDESQQNKVASSSAEKPTRNTQTKLHQLTKNLFKNVSKRKSRQDSETSTKSNNVIELVSSTNAVVQPSNVSSRKQSLTKQTSLGTSNQPNEISTINSLSGSQTITKKENDSLNKKSYFIIDDEEEDIF